MGFDPPPKMAQAKRAGAAKTLKRVVGPEGTPSFLILFTFCWAVWTHVSRMFSYGPNQRIFVRNNHKVYFSRLHQ
ncbi:hypothetical protein FHT77_001863 [Rhizobium sp. BK181]|nr:hypothetical protein [Rhizobium sp. BK181]